MKSPFDEGNAVPDNETEQNAPKTVLGELENFPNPFTNHTTISFFIDPIPVITKAVVKIFNLSGQLAWEKEIFVSLSQRKYRVTRNGKSLYGLEIPCGIYFYQIQYGKEKLNEDENRLNRNISYRTRPGICSFFKRKIPDQ